ncbi:DUF6199 family natural product biosynthesis protein [Streptomyces griseus]|uniref:DUF6199 family natural product biosynthesis protein n=1 Tax=Streptomyces griseus TaxID=1911 RepID=UPI000B23EA83|nr:DUF6199 family natural product biosynthesis protein [Streptomyces griseus]
MTRTASGTSSALLIPILCLLLILGLIQVARPQLLWRANARLQKGWVKDPGATEPTAKGYAVHRITGVIFLAVATWILIRAL